MSEMLGRKVPSSFPNPPGAIYASVTVMIFLNKCSDFFSVLETSGYQKAWFGSPGFDVRLYASNHYKNIKNERIRTLYK